MQEFEKLGVFYLGREYDLEHKKSKDNLLLYDSKDLVTHAVCVGMTGSGKTGLCIGILEEAAIDGIPAIVIDPKGDLANLLLTFPDLKPDDFLPWINEEDARKKGLSVQEYADKQAYLWKQGLSEWGQNGERIQRLRNAADFVIYTPGSSAGIPVSILKSFEAPERGIVEDSDLLRERINTTVTSLLNLLGIEADPIQSREHILLSTILDLAWRQGQNLDLTQFIQSIQSPPVSRIGVFDVESFFPSKERFSLAMKMNNLLAAPGFHVWLEGEPLDINSMLYSNQGKPRVAIFSIAHLNDAERMFFVSLLLTQLLGWMRTQSGTTSLRSLLYMDEIFGYFPPVANPPSKAPLLTLLKQARAFGLGIVLATQNPVDLDYKGLSNTGTWFIGRLQTERDKARVIDGLEGASSSAGGRFDHQRMEQILASLGSRIFLMNNVHEDSPVIFETRWVMSYLRGPLTRAQIKLLMDEKNAARELPVESTPEGTIVAAEIKTSTSSSRNTRPLLPPNLVEHFLPARTPQPEAATLYYDPMLLAIGKTYYANAKIGIATDVSTLCLLEFSDTADGIHWDAPREISMSINELNKYPHDDEALFGELPAVASQQKNYLEWSKGFQQWLYRNQKLELLKSPSLQLVSAPGESEREFRIRMQQAAHEKRDVLVERVRQSYAPKIAKLEERIRKAAQAVEREKEQASQQKLQTAISFGATILSSLMGRKKVSSTTLGRAATTASRAGRIFKEGKDVDRAADNVQELERQMTDLQNRLTEETEQIRTAIDPLTEELETFVLTPKKMDISVSLVALAWVPFWLDKKGGLTPAV